MESIKNLSQEQIKVLVKIAIIMEERTEEYGFDYAYETTKKELNSDDETFRMTLTAIMELKKYL